MATPFPAQTFPSKELSQRKNDAEVISMTGVESITEPQIVKAENAAPSAKNVPSSDMFSVDASDFDFDEDKPNAPAGTSGVQTKPPVAHNAPIETPASTERSGVLSKLPEPQAPDSAPPINAPASGPRSTTPFASISGKDIAAASSVKQELNQLMNRVPYAPSATFGPDDEVTDNPANVGIGKGDQPIAEGGAGEERKAA